MGLKLHQYDTNTTAEIDTFQLVFIREIRREITVSREKSRNIQKRLLYFNRSEQWLVKIFQVGVVSIDDNLWQKKKKVENYKNFFCSRIF